MKFPLFLTVALLFSTHALFNYRISNSPVRGVKLKSFWNAFYFGKKKAKSKERVIGFSAATHSLLQAYVACSIGFMVFDACRAAWCDRKGSQSELLRGRNFNEFERELAQNVINPSAVTKGFEHLGGLSDIKEELLSHTVVISHPARMHCIDSRLLASSSGLLLYGPPGCGKTALVKALCKESQYPVINISPSALLRKYVGESPQLTKAIFSLARKLQPCIVFIDEMDSLFRSRRDSDHVVERNLLTEFVQLWDELSNQGDRVLVLGSSNRPQDLDPCVLRRFEKSLFVGPPDRSAREEIFRVLLANISVEHRFDWQRCAEWTDGYSSSDILRLCRSAVKRLWCEDMERRKLTPGGVKEMAAEQDREELSTLYSRPLSLLDIRLSVLQTKPTGQIVDSDEDPNK